MESSQASSELMDGGEVTNGKSILHQHNVLKLQSMVNQDGPSQRLEAQSGGMKGGNPMGGRKQGGGRYKSSKSLHASKT